MPGFDGGRCQQTHIGFPGDGWAWLATFPSCGYAHISLEFLTERDNSVLLYSGPMSVINNGKIIYLFNHIDFPRNFIKSYIYI